MSRSPVCVASLAAVALTLVAAAAVASTPPRSKPPVSRGPAPSASSPKRPPAPLPTPPKPLIEMAKDIRALEERGAYARAAEAGRLLAHFSSPDADLELAIALDEARSGRLDSAAVRFRKPILEAAIVDTLPVSRRLEYPWEREPLWINGHFDGWSWYVARARAEVASALGHWDEARDAARQAVQARPLAGKEWLVLAVCAGRAGDVAEAATAAERATWLDPSLPEAHYLDGLYAWRGGRHAEAQRQFRAAVALDSSYRAPAIALVRSRLPLVAADTLPGALLTGARRVALLTSDARPKTEEFEQMDSQPVIVTQPSVELPEPLRATLHDRLNLVIPVFVDTRGRIVAHELPWTWPAKLPEEVVHNVLGALPDWRFRPAVRLGTPQPVWSAIEWSYEPSKPK